MGRRKTQILLGTDELARLQQIARSDKDRRARERARFALLAGTGEHTLDEMARKLGRQRSTLQNWLGKFQAGGVAALLDRRTPPGSVSPLSGDTLQAQLRAGLLTGQWRSAEDLARWLKRTLRIKRSRKSLYYWLAKLGVREGGLRKASATKAEG